MNIFLFLIFPEDGHQKRKEIFIDHIGMGENIEDADPWISISRKEKERHSSPLSSTTSTSSTST